MVRHPKYIQCAVFLLPMIMLSKPVEAQNGTSFAQNGLAIINGFLVFFMQLGFISLELGYIRAKNVRNILLKNTVNILLAGVCWWAMGYAFAYGRDAAGFIGTSRFFEGSGDPGTTSRGWFFSWTFAVSTATIVSGCLAERTALIVYPMTTILLTLWVHAIAVHWAWHPSGWLQSVSRCQFLDFAGGSIVHCIGGMTGLVGAWFVGPRIGRFEDGQAKTIPGHDVASVSIGTFMLWFGWYGFNVGSTYSYPGQAGYLVDQVALNMTLSACFSGLTTLAVTSLATGTMDLCTCCNGLLMGLVTATGSCGYIPPWASAVSGILAGLLYQALSKLLVKLSIDDPLDSSVIHVGGGLLGVILNGAFAKPDYVQAVTLGTADAFACGGFFMSKSDGGMQLGMQLLGVAVICGWALLFACLGFWALSRFASLRVDQATELAGIDIMEHGGPAFPEFNLVMSPIGGASRA